MFCNGAIISPDNVPEVGASVHAVMDFYGGDPDDPDAWYNWTEAGGFPTVTDN